MQCRPEEHEIWGLLALSVLHIVIFPLLISYGSAFWGWSFGGLSTAELNFVYYAVDLLLCFKFAGGLLRRSFDSLLDMPLASLWALVMGAAVYFALNLLVPLLVSGVDFLGNAIPNQEVVKEAALQQRGVTAALALFMAPIVEETIFRGGIFCGLRDRSRLLAYVLSAAAFALYHVWQFAFAYSDARYLLFAVYYLPASLALCVCCDKSGSLWTCIALHMILNALALAMI